MGDQFGETFIQQLNQNIGIAHKVCRLYFMNTDDRNDALQEMMYQLCKSYSTFDGRSKFSTWMYSVCLNTALTYKRKARKHRTEELQASHHQIADHNSGDKEAAVNLLMEVVATLPPVNKAIVLLYLEDLSYDEIAAITGLTKANVSVRLVRIKKELEVEMKKKIKSIEDANA
jgi:RNA polymerase sigma-70 factor (ECF subfamily)